MSVTDLRTPQSESETPLHPQVFPAVPYGLSHDTGAAGQCRGWSQEGLSGAPEVGIPNRDNIRLLGYWGIRVFGY